MRKRGFRVTKQRELILDIVFEHECASCKEIYYQAIQRDPGIGMATVYRMVNTLTDIGVLKVATLKPQTALGSGSGCQILLKNQNKIVLNQTEWTEVLQNVLRRKGYNYNAADEIVEVTIQ
nr:MULTISPECIES: transcriptional repressor [Coprococcus]